MLCEFYWVATKHLGSYSCRPPFKFCHSTLFTRKEASNFEAVSMLFGSIEKSFSSMWQSCRGGKMVWMPYHLSLPGLKVSLMVHPYFLDKVQRFSHGSTRPLSNWLQTHLQWYTTGFLHCSLRKLLPFSPTLMLPAWPQIFPFSSSLPYSIFQMNFYSTFKGIDFKHFQKLAMSYSCSNS